MGHLTQLLMFLMFVVVKSQRSTPIPGDYECDFDAFTSDCEVWIMGEPVRVLTTVNICNAPVDVSVTIQSSNTSGKWQHTFANSDEAQEVAPLSASGTVHLRVSLNFENLNVLHVQAQFFEKGEPRDFFINSVVQLSEQPCSAHSSFPGLIPLFVFGTLLALILGLGVLSLYIKTKQRCRMNARGQLLDEEEISSSPELSPEHMKGHSVHSHRGHSVHSKHKTMCATTVVVHNAAYTNDAGCSYTVKGQRSRRKRRRKKRPVSPPIPKLVVEGHTVYKEVNLDDEQ